MAKATLDAERASRAKRIEDAATAFYTAADQRDGALAKVSEAEAAMSKAIGSLGEQDETVERIATLCGIAAGEVRRLRKLSNVTDAVITTSNRAKPTTTTVAPIKDTTIDGGAGDPVRQSA